MAIGLYTKKNNELDVGGDKGHKKEWGEMNWHLIELRGYKYYMTNSSQS
jgi:hypothetical protein